MRTTENRTLEFDNEVSVVLPFHARAIRRTANFLLVLLDPDDYLNDESYRAAHSSGEPPLRNLIAFDKLGKQAWLAEMPETVDYYYLIEDGLPIRALSYSGHRCVIDERTGRIIDKEFLK